MAVTDRLRITLGPFAGNVGEAELSDYSSVTVTMNNEDGCDLSITASASSPAAQLISELATDFWVYLGTTLMQRFRCTSVEQNWDEEGNDDLTIAGVCYRRILSRRLLNNDLSFDAVSQGDIAWAVVSDTQSADGGDLGITPGTLDPTLNDREYIVGENIGEILSDLSNVIGGPRIVVGGDRVLNVFPAGTFTTQRQPIMLGATARKLSRASGAGYFSNAIQGLGDEGRTDIVFRADAASVAVVGRWEEAQAWSSVTSQPTLIEQTEGQLQVRVSPSSTWAVTLEVSRWLSDLPLRVGEVVKVVVPRSTVAPVGTPTTAVQTLCVDLALTATADGELSVSGALVELPSDL
jgi:hypothetical protein